MDAYLTKARSNNKLKDAEGYDPRFMQIDLKTLLNLLIKYIKAEVLLVVNMTPPLTR